MLLIQSWQAQSKLIWSLTPVLLHVLATRIAMLLSTIPLHLVEVDAIICSLDGIVRTEQFKAGMDPNFKLQNAIQKFNQAQSGINSSDIVPINLMVILTIRSGRTPKIQWLLKNVSFNVLMTIHALLLSGTRMKRDVTYTHGAGLMIKELLREPSLNTKIPSASQEKLVALTTQY